MRTHSMGGPVVVFSCLLLLLIMPKDAAADKAFTGVFQNPELTLKLAPADSEGEYIGEIAMGKQTFPVSAKLRGETLAGSFRADDGSFDFTAVLANGTLTFTTEGTTYKLTKRPANPLAKTQAPSANPLARTTLIPKGPTEATKETQLPEGPGSGPAWKKYQHPTGFSMSYPPDWEARVLGQALQMVPPNASSNEKGPTEAYFITGEGAAGITSAEDPRVLIYLETQLATLVPFLHRVGEVEKIRAGATPGILVRWEGTNPDGLKIQAQSLATIMKGYGIGIFALGEAKQISTREKTLRGIFASFAAGAGQKDPQLVGSWKFWSYHGSTTGNYSTEQTRFMALAEDGTCAWSSNSESIATVKGKDSLGNDTFQGGVAGTRTSADRGTWSAGEGKLYILWQDGTVGEWSYVLQGVRPGRHLFLTSGTQNKPDEWMETGL